MDADLVKELTKGLARLSLSPPPRFSKKGELPFKEWRILFECYVNDGKFTDMESINKLISLFDGEALSLALALPNRSALSIKEFLDQIEARISPVKDPREYKYRFQTRLQQPSESIQAYTDDLYKIARLAYPTYNEDQIEDFVVEKLLSSVRLPKSTNRAALFQQNFLKSVDIIKYVQQWIAAEKFSSRCDSSLNEVFNVSEDNFGVAAVNNSIRCYFCKKSGHFKGQCPTLKSIKCFSCGNFGHLARNCSYKNSENSQGASRKLGRFAPNQN